MTTARKNFMNPCVVGTYHLFARCIRRAFLQSYDQYTGKDYSHRNEWIPNHIKHLVKAYAIDIGSFAIMDNRVRPEMHNSPPLEGW